MRIAEQPNFKYASVDLETTGLDAGDCRIIQFGIVLDDLKTPIAKLPKREWLVLQRDGIYPGQAFVLQMNAHILKQIAKAEDSVKNNQAYVGLPFCYEEELPHKVATWLQAQGWDGKKITFAGKNFGTFDREFLDMIDFFDTVPMTHRVIDPGSMVWNPAIDGGTPPNTKTVCERLGVDAEVKHTALADAEQVVRIIRAVHGPGDCKGLHVDTPLDGPRILNINAGSTL